MLSSQEVGTLVTALGCGIGRDEFDPDKLRYHRVVIMTDADVDGSHIRTLLLTFFFRQMPELLERGHVFIAQPPLYKVKRGKQERYVKDDAELDAHFRELALQNAELFVNAEAPALSGENLEQLVLRLSEVLGRLDRLQRKLPVEVSRHLLRLPGVSSQQLANQADMEQWAFVLEGLLQQQVNSLATVRVEHDTEHNVYTPVIQIMLKGVTQDFVLSNNFFESDDYQVLGALANELNGLL